MPIFKSFWETKFTYFAVKKIFSSTYSTYTWQKFSIKQIHCTYINIPLKYSMQINYHIFHSEIVLYLPYKKTCNLHKNTA